MNKYKFYDTSALLLKKQILEDENIIISSITLQELENIKVSKNKDDALKAQARKLLHVIDNDKENIEVIIYKTDMMEPILEKNLEPSDDMKILACAFWCDCNLYPDDITFVTNDLALKEIAGLFFGSDSIESFYPVEEQYKGFKEVAMTQEELSDFYSNPTFNKYDLMINEYIIIREQETGKIIDKAKWDGETHKHITYTTFDSKQFGIVRPYKDDVYQQLAMDSLVNNQVTMLFGKPGSGKTFLAFGYLFSLLEKHAIDKIIVFCNPAVVRNSAQLGLYPGTQLEKLLQTQAGSILSSKLGDQYAVEQLIAQNKLQIIPVCDARGYQTPPHSAVYIMESQNLTSDLLRLLLQRVDEDTRVIVDGDFEEQVDNEAYAKDNGMIKMTKVFKGEKIYGQVELKIIHRSKIAVIADGMK